MHVYSVTITCTIILYCNSINSTGRISANESLFTYIVGQSASTFDNPSFTPVFDATDLPFANMPGVAEVCGDSLECLFDVGATGNLDVGRAAVDVHNTYNETVEVSQPSEYIFVQWNLEYGRL